MSRRCMSDTMRPNNGRNKYLGGLLIEGLQNGAHKSSRGFRTRVNWTEAPRSDQKLSLVESCPRRLVFKHPSQVVAVQFLVMGVLHLSQSLGQTLGQTSWETGSPA